MVQCINCDAVVESVLAHHAARDGAELVVRNLIASGLPRAYRTGERTLADVPTSEATSGVLEACEALGGDVPGLYLYGESRAYKTTIAAALLAAQIRSGTIKRNVTGRYVDVTELLVDIEASYRDDDLDARASLVRRFGLTPRLVFDDLGHKRATEHAGDVIRQILDLRFREKKPGDWIIVTSNFDLDSLCNRFEIAETGNAIRHRLGVLTAAVSMN